MSKMKIGKYLCLTWMILTTAVIVLQNQRIDGLENSYIPTVEITK